MLDFAKLLKDVRSKGMECNVGGKSVFRYTISTPAHKFESVIADMGSGRLVELTARDSFDDRLAAFLLARLAKCEPPGLRSKTIRVINTPFPEPWSFSAVVIVPPIVAKRFEHESAVLQKRTYWAVPAFDGEFADMADGASFWHELGRKDGWRIVVVRWNRTRKLECDFDT